MSVATLFNPTKSTNAFAGDGVAAPRVTTVERLAIPLGTGDRGMQVYDTDLSAEVFWTGTQWVVMGDGSNGWLSVKMFGAKGDGITDDTAAIQTAINQVCPLGYGLLFPNGTYRITTSLKIPTGTTGWTFLGTAQGVRIVQHAITGDSQAVFEFLGGGISQWEIVNFRCEWNTLNPISGYKACVFLFSWDGISDKNAGVYNFQIDNVFGRYGFRFLSNYNTGSGTSDGVNVWGVTVNRCASVYMNGAMVRLTNAGAGGMTNVCIRNSYYQGNTAGLPPESSPYVYSEALIQCDSANGWKLDNFEVNSVASSVYLILVTGASALEYSNVRVEAVYLTTSTNSGLSWTIDIGLNIVSFDYSRIIVKAGQTVSLFRHQNSLNHKVTIGTLDNNQQPGYPAVILEAGAACYLIDATPGSIAVASNITETASANRYAQTAPVWDGNRKWTRVAVYATTYTPFASYINFSANYWEITSPGPTLTINPVSGAFEGQEYVFDIVNDGGTLATIAWNAAYRQDGNALPVGAGKRKTVRFIYVNGVFVQVGGVSGNI